MYIIWIKGNGFRIRWGHGKRFGTLQTARAEAYRQALLDCKGRSQSCVVDMECGYASHVKLGNTTSITEYTVGKA